LINPTIMADAKHPIAFTGPNAIQIEGLPTMKFQKCFCIYASGHRYHEFGISAGSLLLCQRGAVINDGDLVLVDVEDVLTIYQYRKDRKIKQDGEKRILHNKSKAYAKILGAFNIYD